MKEQEFSFVYRGRKIKLKVKICRTFFSKLMGLMFRRLKDCPNLLFVFNKKTREGIHSFYVFFKFIAIWFDNNKIIDVKIVSPGNLYISPKNKFNKLLEIPLRNDKISKFLVERKV